MSSPLKQYLSPDLKQYLRDAYVYYTTGIHPAASQYGHWMEHVGLCINCPNHIYNELLQALHQRFGTSSYPFHDSILEYNMEKYTPAMNKNPRRLAWLREVLGIEEGAE